MSGAHPPHFANAEVMLIDPADVFVPPRIGFLHEDKAVALGRLMAVVGQRDPIKVKAHKGKQKWKLVVGRHRLRGAELEGLQVTAIEVIGNEEDLADMEASENLHRRPLGPIERAMFVHALCQAAQERIARQHGTLDQHKLGAKARWERVKGGESRVEEALQEESEDAADKMSAAYGWQESAADALDLDKRTIRRSLELYRLVIEPFPELAEALSKHPVVGENAAQLKLIAQVYPETARRSVIEALLADNEIGVDDARINAGIDAPAGSVEAAPHQKHFNAIDGAWSRLGTAERNRYLREKFVILLTPGQKRELRDRLNEELGE